MSDRDFEGLDDFVERLSPYRPTPPRAGGPRQSQGQPSQRPRQPFDDFRGLDIAAPRDDFGGRGYSPQRQHGFNDDAFVQHGSQIRRNSYQDDDRNPQSDEFVYYPRESRGRSAQHGQQRAQGQTNGYFQNQGHEQTPRQQPRAPIRAYPSRR